MRHRSDLAATLCIVFFAAQVEALPGDYNDDGIVDGADYTLWADNLGSDVALSNDDTPGTVDGADYTIWADNFGATGISIPPGPATPGPEDPFISVDLLGTLSDGSYEFVVVAHKNAMEQSLAFEIAIDGLVQQVQFMGTEVDEIFDAAAYDGIDGYEFASDTWYNSIFLPVPNPGNNPFAGVVTIGYQAGGDGESIFFSFGGGPSTATSQGILHLVMAPDSGGEPGLGNWSGIVAQNGVAYETFGAIVIPLPPAAFFLSSGVAALFFRHRLN